MAPKKVTAAASQKKAAAGPSHASYKGMPLLLCRHHVVARLQTNLECDREALLTRFYRYDQGSYPHCKSTVARAIMMLSLDVHFSSGDRAVLVLRCKSKVPGDCIC